MGISTKFFAAKIHFEKNRCSCVIGSFFQQCLSVVLFLVEEQKKPVVRRKSRESACSLTCLHSEFCHSPSYSFVWFNFTWPHSKIFHTKITSLERIILMSLVLYVTNSKCSVNSNDWQREEGAKEKHCCFRVLPKPLSNTKAKVFSKNSLKFSWKALLFLKAVRVAKKIFLEQ